MQYILLVIVLGIYGLLNYYIGLRGFQSISAQIPVNKAIYWAIIILLASMFILAMSGKKYLPDRLENLFYTLGGYWLAALVYLIAFVLIIDIFRILANRLNFMPGILKDNTWAVAFAVISAVAVILAVGTYNAVVPKVVAYNINIDKKAGDIKQVKIAMISDVHLGKIIGRDRLKKAVDIINGLEPDIVVITGDLIDGDIEPVVKENMLSELKNINAAYGAFAVLGNHEYYGGKPDEITGLIEQNGVTVLRDRYVKIQDSFYLVGREDKASKMSGYARQGLKTLIGDIDSTLPIIVLDHQPSGLDEPRAQQVDLQLSGHTHAGQFFPISSITSLMYEQDNGYLKDGTFNLLVSSGLGSWGPAVRIGSQSQIVNLTVNFK